MSEHLKLISLPMEKKTGIYRLETGDYPNFCYSDGAEDKLLKIIKATTDRSSDSLELEYFINDWPTKYHFSHLRTNIFRSLDFLNRDSKVLEVGAGCGAITRYLGEHFKSVDAIEGSYKRAIITKERCEGLNNVRVCCTPFQDVIFDKEYDIVTLIGVLEYAPVYYSPNDLSDIACLKMLKHALSALKEDGFLILAIENKFGLKYWSGCKEDHTNRLFDSLHGYPEDKSPITFSRDEIKQLLTKAQIKYNEFYYPFPDYKLASTIIKEIPDPSLYYLHNWIKTPFDEYLGRREYYFNERLVMKSLIGCGLFYEFSNSFLILSSLAHDVMEKHGKANWLAKQFSTNRVIPYRTLTTLNINEVSNSPIIQKQKLFNMEIQDIKVKMRVDNSEWIPGDLMRIALCKAIYKDNARKEIITLLREYYNQLLDNYYWGVMDDLGYPLLKPEAIDYVPWNIVINNNKYCVIDLEWVYYEPVSADYVLFRSIFTFICEEYNYIYKYSSIQIYDIDDLVISFMQEFFPNYTKYRNEANKKREADFQNIISGGICKTFSSKEVESSIIQSNQEEVIRQLRAQIYSFRNSWSWKITTPLRWLYGKYIK